jgi:hypothetical protein
MPFWADAAAGKNAINVAAAAAAASLRVEVTNRIGPT